ncbi:ATP-grasp domain-containing protein [Microbacterium sp. LWO13-1.2]|uniref:ATP-grasp domain-containing protein n=1 Tax=Microbacterium sp. LWO13-1.2 TaxID=3135262 RepID=UPI003139D909
MAGETARTSWLLSSAGRRGSLVNLLKQQPMHADRSRVIATDRSELSAAGRLADVFEQVPSVRDEAFIPRTLEIARLHDVGVIIPTIDPEIEVYANHRDEFAEQGVDVWVSSPEVSRLGWDKWALYQWLREQGLPTVETFEVSDLPTGALAGAVVAKPRSGSSGIGVVLADSVEALNVANLDESYIIQSRAPGFEVTVDFAVGRDGRVLGIVPRRRIEVRGGEVSKGVTVDYPAVIEVARQVATRLPGAYGALNVQVFYEPSTRELNIIEINPRFGGGYPLAHLAGANFFDALLRDGRGEDIPELEWNPGTLLLRYDTEVIVSGFDIRSLDA